MPLASNCSPCCAAAPRAAAATVSERRPRLLPNAWSNSNATYPFLRLSENEKFNVSRLAVSHTSWRVKDRTISMALVSDTLGQREDVTSSSSILAYELIQGANVRWNSVLDKSIPDPPTAVFLHGILGCRKNWGTFAKRMAREFPTWQFLLVDLRCHGDSASINKRGPHTVASAALDVLKLVRKLRITPRVLVGHSFGGKVVLSMVDQAAKPLARPVRVWVLDATPGKVRAGGDGEDHPAELISLLSTLPREVDLQYIFSEVLIILYITLYRKVSSKRDIVKALTQQGFSNDVAQWVVTNLRPTNSFGSRSSGFSWVFDLRGIAEMYQSYEETNLWYLL
ncbi:hypothetical protein Ahy_B05g078816 isoform B [Arachis hypogaea]|uniref:AB hydrolase-1 domain-containing protein n=1 Tax=Arachis hypogaea TaxID=3818 RepID=A0A444Z844_ARAHY|nr:hypothetical protein Ahy_B05g078816 isoform B [Arachis hypogaea]